MTGGERREGFCMYFIVVDDVTSFLFVVEVIYNRNDWHARKVPFVLHLRYLTTPSLLAHVPNPSAHP